MPCPPQCDYPEVANALFNHGLFDLIVRASERTLRIQPKSCALGPIHCSPFAGDTCAGWCFDGSRVLRVTPATLRLTI